MSTIVESHIRDGVTTVTIESGEALSPAIDLIAMRLAAIVMPSAWTTANLTFQGSIDGTNFFDVYNAGGTEYTVLASTSRVLLIPYADFIGLRYIKIRSGTTGTPVQQQARRTLNLSRTA